jgi:hypothetical protein
MTENEQIAAKVQRRPLAWGAQEWGPLPDTENLFVQWWPSEGLSLVNKAAIDPSGQMRPIVGYAGPFERVVEAEAAVRAFITAGLDQADDDPDEGTEVHCATCGGPGSLYVLNCTACGGTGYVTVGES